jgi:hypothetical protein
MRPAVPGERDGMSILHGNDVSNPSAGRPAGSKRETRESAARILMALAIVLTVSSSG